VQNLAIYRHIVRDLALIANPVTQLHLPPPSTTGRLVPGGPRRIAACTSSDSGEEGMDFWDVAKRMFRRWYLTAPLLLLTAAATAWISTEVGPDYQATSYVAVLPPTLHRNESAREVTQVNPWTVEALADAAAIRLMGGELAEQIKADGYEAEWTVEVTGIVPVLRLDVVAQSPEEASAVTARLLDVIDDEVTELQAEHRLEQGEQITTVRYDDGNAIEVVTTGTKRAMLAVAGAGLIVTMATVVAVDALVRRRRARATVAAVHPGPVRRRYPLAGTLMSATPERSHGDPVAGAMNGGMYGRAAARGQFPVQMAYTEPAKRSSSVAVADASGEEPAPDQQPAPPDQERPPADREQAPDNDPVEPAGPQNDATLILPLSNLLWPQANPENGDQSAKDRKR
jgi:capsular polysaccharide biosynthesis protein